MAIGFLPVNDRDPSPEPGSDKEREQLAAIWRRIGNAVVDAWRKHVCFGAIYILAGDELPEPKDLDWPTVLSEVVPPLGAPEAATLKR